MEHRVAPDDRAFQATFEACEMAPAAFDHAAHVRLAYIYLCDGSMDGAMARMKNALLGFLAHHGVGPEKYHETLTGAWLRAVDHFMARSPACSSATDFIAANPRLLDPGLLLTHYSAAALFSPKARMVFVDPDIQNIPPPAPGETCYAP